MIARRRVAERFRTERHHAQAIPWVAGQVALNVVDADGLNLAKSLVDGHGSTVEEQVVGKLRASGSGRLPE